MSYTFNAIYSDGRQRDVLVDLLPDQCPVCKTGIRPISNVAARVNTHRGHLYLALICPISSCGIMFTAIYRFNQVSRQYFLLDSGLFNLVDGPNFTENIFELSRDFCEIYRQSHIAESNGLNLIAGPGYRKSLEYLIKDYLIKHKYKSDQMRQEKVSSKFLGQCIKDDLDEVNIQRCAERAAWLGNDETHYTRKWGDKDISDLKILIDMTCNWVDLALKSSIYHEQMNIETINS